MTYCGSGLYCVFVLDSSGREIDRREGSRAEVESWFARMYASVPLRFVPVRNPGRGTRKEASAVTDRALRYRANASPPPGPRICAFCGSQRNVEVGHINGHEEDCSPANLLWTCRRCNVRCGNTLRRAGLGRLTRQYNPSVGGAENLGEWLNAVLSFRSEGGTMTVGDAVEMVHSTPASDRSRFAREIWDRRRSRYGAKGRAGDETPF